MRSAAASVTTKACFCAIALFSPATFISPSPTVSSTPVALCGDRAARPPPPPPQPLEQRAQPLRLVRHLSRGKRGGAAEPNAERGRQGAGAHAALLAAALDQRKQPDPWPAPNVERADSLGAVQFVAGDRHQVDL